MRILSWNIQWGLGIDGRVDLARIASVAREFEADVLCLQEVALNHPGLPGGAAMNQAEWLGGLFLGYEAAFGVASDLPDGVGGRRQFGNLILSRRPILQIFRHSLPWPADSAVPSMQRAALEISVAAAEFPGAALRVMTTHLEYYSVAQRTAQMEALRRLCDAGWQQSVNPPAPTESDPPFAVLPRGEACVLCGDFNCPAGAAEYAALWRPDAAPALVDAATLGRDSVPPAPTFGVHERGYLQEAARYDAFFVSADIAARVRGVEVDLASQASDHQPLLLVLE